MAESVFPLTLDDTSPTIAYAPFADTFGLPNLTAGWNPYYTDSGFSTDSGPSSSSSGVSNIGNGTSLHVTAHDGAQFAIRWNGTDISIYGTVTAPSSSAFTYSVSLDGTSTTNYISSISQVPSVNTASTDILAQFANLTDTSHEVVLTVHIPGMSSKAGTTNLDAVVAFDRAVIDMDGSGSQATPTSSQLPPATSTPTTTSVPDNLISYRGQWSYEPGLLPDSPSSAFHTSTSVGDTAYVNFNGTAVTLAGLTTPSSGRYNITLDNTSYSTLSARSSFTASAPTILFYASDLDPEAMHSLEITNAGPAVGEETSYLVVLAGGVNVTTLTPPGPAATPVGATSTSSSLARGTVAAITIGATLAVIAVIGLVAMLVLWRRRITRRKQSFIENPQVGYWRTNWRRWLGPGPTQPEYAHGPGAGTEKHDMWEDGRRRSRTGVLNIGMYRDDDEKMEGDVERGQAKGKAVTRPRHASQNSDGSFSIELPELSSTPLEYPPHPFPSTPQPLSLMSQISTVPRVAPSTSPRSARPRGPRDMHGRDSSRGILLSEAISPMSEDEGEDDIPALRVEFAQEQRRPERRTERYLSAGGLSLPHSLMQALSRSRDAEDENGAGPSGESRPSTFLSFLDFSSSSSSSVSGGRSRSLRRSASNSRSNSTRSSRKSRRNTGSERSTNSTAPPERRMSLGLSMTVGGGPTASRPSLTPDISLRVVPLPPPVAIPSDVHPRDVSFVSETDPDQMGMPSPTDSLPLTMSEIHFRHSVHSTTSHVTESRRTSAIRSSNPHPPHPPLPMMPSSSSPPSPIAGTHTRDGSQVIRSTIVQKLMGLPVTDSTASTPAVTPTTATVPRSPAAPPEPGPSTSGTPATSSLGHRTGFSFSLGRHR